MGNLLHVLLTLLASTSGYIHRGRIWAYRKPVKSEIKDGRIEGGGRFLVVRKGGRCETSRWYRLWTGHWVCSPYFVVNKKRAGGLTNWIPRMYNRQYVRGTGKITYMALRKRHINTNRWRKLKHLRGFLPVKRLLIGIEPYLRLFSGGYLSSRSVKPYTVSNLMGLSVKRRDFPVAFVTTTKAMLYKRVGRGKYRPWKSIPRYAVRPVRSREKGWYYVRYAPFAHLRESDIKIARTVPPKPSKIRKNEAWVYASLSQKILIAMRGSRPVKVMLFAASPKTLTGQHRIFLNRVYQNYDLVHSTDGYYLEAVPYVMYYNKGFAIHAAYWHDDFPSHKTHGCINLSMKDAKWLFTFLNPKFPRGFIELRNAKGRGALVHIVP